MKIIIVCSVACLVLASVGVKAQDKKGYGYGHENDVYVDDKAYGNEKEYVHEEHGYDHGKESYDKDSYDKDSYDKDSYDKDSHGKDSYGKDDDYNVEYRHGVAYNKQYVYHGKYSGHCGKDGFYYKDAKSFVICSNNNAYVQPCAPGSQNSAHDAYNYGGNYYYRDFCDVNLVDHGYGAQRHHGYQVPAAKGYGYHDGYYGDGYKSGYYGNDRYYGYNSKAYNGRPYHFGRPYGYPKPGRY